MPSPSWQPLVVLFAVAAFAVIGVGVYDLWLLVRHGREATISAAMGVSGRASPMFVFACGVGVGGVVFGLAAHFWW